MSIKMAKMIFWSGTLISVILFLVLTFDTNGQIATLTNADQLNDQVVSGKKAFEKYNCNDCHTILGFGGYYAPDLTRVHSRLGEDTIRRIIAHPENVFKGSYRKMPNQNLSEPEIDNLVAFFKWVSNIMNNDWPPQHSLKRWKKSTKRLLVAAKLSPGAALIKQEECLACHALGDQGGDKGPRLEWIAKRQIAPWIAEYLADPQKFSEGAEMPDYNHLSKEQRQMIAEFIISLRTNN